MIDDLFKYRLIDHIARPISKEEKLKHLKIFAGKLKNLH